MRQSTSPSFKFLEPDEIAQAFHLSDLAVPKKSSGQSGGEAWTCAWAPDNSYFAWSCGHRILHLIPWDHDQQKSDTEGLHKRKHHIIDCSDLIWSLAFGSGRDQKNILGFGGRLDPSLLVATGLAGGKIKLWNCLDGTLISELLDHRNTVRSLDFTKDGSLQLVSASRDGTLKLWDIPDGGNMYSTFRPPGIVFTGCCFSPNALFVVGVGTKRMVYLWRRSSTNDRFAIADLHVKLDGHCNEVSACDFSPDSALLATASFDTKVIVWNVNSLEKLQVLGHMHPSPRMIFAGGANDHYVRSVSFCPDGLTLTSVCEDGYARFWRLDTHPDDPFTVAEVPDALCCRMAPSRNVLAVGFRDGNVTMFSACQPIPSLMHIARLSILKQLKSSNPGQLPLPNTLLQFLRYRDLLNNEAITAS